MSEGPARSSILFGASGVRAGWRLFVWILLSAAGFLILFPGATAAGVPPTGAFFIAMLAGCCGAGWFTLLVLDARRPGALGFPLDRSAPSDGLRGFLIGCAQLGGAVALIAATGGARWVADDGTIPEYAAALALSLVQFAVAAAAEEAAFRGYGLQVLVEGIGPWPAILLSSALFAWVHADNPNANALGLVNIFLAGVMLAVVYLRTRSLWAATAVHAGWNWMMSALLDFPVSGLQLDTPLYDARELGADWWTGGAFGPEAGLAATLVIVAATAWMLRTPLLRESGRMRELRPLVDSRIGPDWPK